jgi:predicted nucleic acid-binding protein
MIDADPPAYAICDAGPLIHLDEVDCLDLLNDFQTALVTPIVWREALRHRPGLHTDRLKMVETPAVAPVQVNALARLMGLHAGETEALSLALQHPGCILLSDDSAARLAAKQLGIAVHGTIGILLRAIRRRQRSRMEVIELLRALPERSSLHIEARLLREILSELANMRP